ncbi:hypothetical protein [Aeromonas sp.]|uniref:hypothetical protein n=1 Tax=Aeromonas sp. TaxID=647 RepID=UPI00258AF7A8|nr:hypothetical protein [Aeromonas sp.]MCX7132304.1 hypothetical protein [Aeromonas sp.]
MTNETTLLALLESREAEANAEAEWVAEWCESSCPLLLAGLLETDPATLLGELGSDQYRQYNLAICRMLGGDHMPLMQFIQQVVDAGLTGLAQAAWNDHVAALHDAMSDEQWEQYQDRRNAA